MYMSAEQEVDKKGGADASAFDMKGSYSIKP